MDMNKGLTTWLLDSGPWIEYRTRIDLLDQKVDESQVEKAYKAVLSFPSISNLVDELSEWPGPILKSHKKAGHFLHKLGFLADIGLKADSPGVDKIIKRITEHRSPEGPFEVMVNINPRYGGSGEDEYAWMSCDAPLVTYAMVKFGLRDDQKVQDSLQYLANLSRDNGWPCAVSPKLGSSWCETR